MEYKCSTDITPACLLEQLLTRYYLLESVCGPYLDREGNARIFDDLCDVFCVPKEAEAQTYYELSQNDSFRSICDFASYERFCRTAEFASNSGQDIGMTEQDRVVLVQKRNAMIARADLFKQCKTLTKENIATTLSDASNNGYIDAISTRAYLEYHGICIKEDKEHALKLIRQCAKWNDIFGNFMGIAYDSGNEAVYYNRLFTIYKTTAKKDVFEHICRVRGYSAECTRDPIARIVDRAFCMGIVRRELYDRIFAKVAFCTIISVEDKEKLLLNKQKDAIAALSDFPFDVKREGRMGYDPGCAEYLVLKRDGEIRRIMQNLAVAARCPRDVYMPLMVVSSDEFVSDMYAAMIKESVGEDTVVEIEGGTLGIQDLAPEKDNFMLRGMSETKNANTVFFIKDCEQIDDKVLEELCKVLVCEYRKKYRLFSPAVSLDLSSLGFVLFANEQTPAVSMLGELCETVKTEKISGAEKAPLIRAIFDKRRADFDCRELVMEDECVAYLSSYSTKQIGTLIDCAIRSAVYDSMNKITLSDMKSICTENNITLQRRGFGYAGGIVNA